MLEQFHRGPARHTYDHASWTGNSTGASPLTRQQRWDELDQTESIIEQLRVAVRAFETTHPTLTSAIGRVADALAGIGIWPPPGPGYTLPTRARSAGSLSPPF
jgi:hypothetical protein